MTAKKNIKSLSRTPKYIMLFNNPGNPDTPQYKQISRTADLLIALNRKARKLKGKLGSCHYIWNLRKKILRERYDIEWHTPQELNPRCKFD